MDQYRILSFIVFLWTAGVFKEVVGNCPDGFVSHGESCYHFSHDLETWVDAAAVCEKIYHAKLVEMNDEFENNFLLNEVHRQGLDYWTGGNDLQVEGEWRWLSSGELISLDSWGPGEPSNSASNENCMEINSDHYNDDRCEHSQRYICEISREVVDVVG